MSPSATPQTRDADDAGKIYSPSLRICWKKFPNHDGTRLGFAPDSPQEGSGFELVWGFSCQEVGFGFAVRSLTSAHLPITLLRPSFVYRHQWQVGDLLMWDNCTVQHRAIQDYDVPQRRLMHRTTMGGTVPL